MSHFNLALFTERFRAAAYGSTFREIADETGVSAPTLSRLDSGSVPSVETLYALCVWMNVSPGAFLLPGGEQTAPHAPTALQLAKEWQEVITTLAADTAATLELDIQVELKEKRGHPFWWGKVSVLRTLKDMADADVKRCAP
jgi:transcriptional regulator with XRE-family HTH domain